MDTLETIPRTATDAAAADTEAMPKRTDKHIWGIYIALIIISIVELYSASSHEVTPANVFAPVLRHVCFLIIGLIFMLMLQRTHYKHFYRWIYVFGAVSALLMLITLFFGQSVNGAQRSLSLPGFAVQPSEMVKLSAALVIAAILCKEQVKGVGDVTTRGVVGVTACVIVGSALLFSQGLTNTLLLISISMSMMIVGGVGPRKFFKVVMVFCVLGMVGIGYKYVKSELSSNEKKETVAATVTKVPGTNVEIGVDDATRDEGGRFKTWVNRMTRFMSSDKINDPITDENQQEQYSYLAQAHGGVFGVMPGNSRETARLPLAFSDYIYAIIIEELGLVGGIVVMVLYLWLLARAGRIATRCQTAFPAFLVIGMAVFITFQAMFHMAIVSGLVPVSGQPLPLISKGGTSIIITSIALGVMLSVSRFAARKGKRAEIKDELSQLSELPDDVRAENPA